MAWTTTISNHAPGSVLDLSCQRWGIPSSYRQPFSFFFFFLFFFFFFFFFFYIKFFLFFFTSSFFFVFFLRQVSFFFFFFLGIRYYGFMTEDERYILNR